MVANTKPGRATYADIANAPENMVAEIINGELVLSPRPSPKHSVTASAIGASTHSNFHGPPDPPSVGGWWIINEPEIHLGDDVFVPDIAGWRTERLSTLPTTNGFTLAPDWVCEVLSPGTLRRDRMAKMPAYARAGVAWSWLVHPINRTVEVFRLDDGHWVLVDLWDETHPDAEAARIPPFDAVPFKLARWWA